MVVLVFPWIDNECIRVDTDGKNGYTLKTLSLILIDSGDITFTQSSGLYVYLCRCMCTRISAIYIDEYMYMYEWMLHVESMFRYCRCTVRCWHNGCIVHYMYALSCKIWHKILIHFYLKKLLRGMVKSLQSIKEHTVQYDQVNSSWPTDAIWRSGSILSRNDLSVACTAP